MGPYSKPPMQGLHCSPMLTRPKTGSDNRRVIVDLSYMVNLSTIWYVRTHIWAHHSNLNFRQKTTLLHAFEIWEVSVSSTKSTFKGLSAILSLILEILTGRAVDTLVPFDYRHGSVCMQRLTDSIQGLMHSKGYFIANYIDYLIGCDPAKVAWEAFKFIKQLIVDSGLVISQGKLFQPQNCIPCLGINVVVETLSKHHFNS